MNERKKRQKRERKGGVGKVADVRIKLDLLKTLHFHVFQVSNNEKNKLEGIIRRTLV